jgi:hypothetical protein
MKWEVPEMASTILMFMDLMCPVRPPITFTIQVRDAYEDAKRASRHLP